MSRIQSRSHEQILGDQIVRETLVRFSDGELRNKSCSRRGITRRSGSNNARTIATRRYKPATKIPLQEIRSIHAGPRVLSMKEFSCELEGGTPLQAGEFNR